MLASRISMQNLKHENLNRDDRIQQRIDPGHFAITTSIGDALFAEFFGPILLELFDDLRNTSHVSLRCVG